MDNTPTVGHVKCGSGMVVAWDGLINFVKVTRGGVYGSRDTTENGGFFFYATNIFII